MRGIIATLLGNVLQEYASWRWIFYIGIIVEVIALAGTAIFYWPNPRPRGDFDKTRWQEFKEIDWIGLFLFAGGLTTFLIGVTWGGSTSHPWDSAGTIVPIVVGFVVTVGAFVYDFTLASNPMFPLSLFKLFRRFSLLIIILFISGMSFYSMTPLLPQGTAYMFTTSGIKIGVYSLPNTIMSGIAGVLGPVVAHKIGYIKWQLCFGLLLQATFTASTAGAVYPNKLHPWIWLPAFGVPIFIYITILSYAIASLHVPHSRLGVAMGLLGTFRSGGGAVGNAIFNTIFENKFSAYVGGEIASAALKNGLSAQDIPEIITGAVEYNLGTPDVLDGIQGMTPAIEAALQTAVRGAYGHAFKITFLTTLAFTVAGLICGLFVEDPTLYMTNHVQSAMPNTQRLLRQDEELSHMEEVSAEEKTTGMKTE
jgi:MFS family permease